MFDDKPIKDMMKFKMRKNLCQHLYMKLKIMKGMNVFNGLTYIEITLIIINTSRKLFLLNIEQGDESLIPCELSQKDLPLSYRFYDPILKVI